MPLKLGFGACERPIPVRALKPGDLVKIGYGSMGPRVEGVIENIYYEGFYEALIVLDSCWSDTVDLRYVQTGQCN